MDFATFLQCGQVHHQGLPPFTLQKKQGSNPQTNPNHELRLAPERELSPRSCHAAKGGEKKRRDTGIVPWSSICSMKDPAFDKCPSRTRRRKRRLLTYPPHRWRQKRGAGLAFSDSKTRNKRKAYPKTHEGHRNT